MKFYFNIKESINYKYNDNLSLYNKYSEMFNILDLLHN